MGAAVQVSPPENANLEALGRFIDNMTPAMTRKVCDAGTIELDYQDVAPRIIRFSSKIHYAWHWIALQR